MYCGECGTKNSNSSKFCENCGAPLVNEHSNIQTDKKNQNKNTQISLKVVIPIIAGVIILIGGIIGYNSLKKKTLPETVAASYFQAYKESDSKKMYQHFDIDANLNNNEFTTEKMFVNTIITDEQKKEAEKISNYEITEVKIEDGGLTATVKIKYTTTTSAIARTKEINLKKSEKKKFLFFDNWKVSLGDSYVRENYSIYLPKESTAKVEGIDISKYLDKDKSSSSYDVYTIPKIFRGEYNIDTKLSYGFNLSEKMNTSSTSYYRVSISKSSLPEKTQKDMISKAKELLNTFYSGAIAKTEWTQLKEKFSKLDEETLKNYESTYATLVSRVNTASRQLTKMEITDITLSSTSASSSDDDGLTVSFKINYSYDLNYKSLFSDEIKTKSNTSNSYVKFSFKYVNKEFVISNIKSLVTSFY